MQPKKYDHLLSLDTPLVFADGAKVYADLAKTYQTHSRGFYILAPSGSGKTHFIQRQIKPQWMDGDDLWQTTLAHPQGPWWLEPIDRIMELEARSDVITQEAKRLGFWIIGGSNTWLKPDAVVIPNWQTHKKYIRIRENNNYDGGATSAQLASLLKSRHWMARWVKQGVPLFKTVEEAAGYLASLA